MNPDSPCDQDADILLQTLLAEMPDVGLMTWAQDGRITLLTERCSQLMQLPEGAAVGDTVAVINDSPCRDLIPVYDAYRRSRRKSVVEQEIELEGSTGAYWLKLSVRRCPKGCGSQSAFLLIARDITLQRRSQEQAMRTRSYFEAALRAIPDAAVFADTQGSITKVSVGAERIFGYPESELLGKPIRSLAEDIDWRAAPADADEADSPPLFQMVESYSREGRRFSAEALTDWIQDEQGRLLGSVAVLRDVSRADRSAGRPAAADPVA